MSSETETAMLALKAALDASADLPAVRRDPVFEDVFEELAAALNPSPSAPATPDYLTVLAFRHGAAVETTRRFGAGPDAFELVRNAEIELYVAGAEGDGLNAAFDAALSAVYAAVEADPTLGDDVIRAEIVEPPELGTDAAGSKAVLTAVIRVQLTYVSPRSY
ncbi:MAG: hypothetical protein FJX45_12235 [Alphaproteobacteria bacterium]|nr:hypothetical protein [Alphaproteobacteria bacterium]MBM3654745.1 hypothetical protein [Alphaproteobacteria bacterium]